MLTAVFLFSGTMGCIHRKPKLPCWVTRPCGDFSEKEFLIGVGSGENLKIADDEAISAVSRHFQVRSLEDSSGETPSNVISVATELKGVQVVERHQQNNMFYALAVLEREPMLLEIDSELDSLQDKVKKLINKADENRSKINKANYYHQVIPLLDRIDILSARREIVDFRNQGWKGALTSNQMRNTERDTLRSIKISIQSDPTAIRCKALLVEVLEARGFVFVDADSDLQIEITAIEAMVPPDQFGFKKTRFKLNLDIYEPREKSRLLFSRRFTAEVASQDLYKSRELAIKQVKEQMISDRLAMSLENRILGEER
jgi:hypothetical protein